MCRLQIPVILAILAALCLAEDNLQTDEGIKPFMVALPNNSMSENGERKKRASQYDCYVPSLRAWKRHGETFQLGGNTCITYRCAYGSYDFIQEACRRFGGDCVPVNSEITYSVCTRLKCIKRDRGNYREYGFEVVGTPMCHVNGRCYRFGEIWDYYCQQKRCVSNGNPGGYDIQDVGLNNRCKDSSGRCWDRGQIFSDWLNGRYYNHCVCYGGSAGYQCYNYQN